MKKETMTSYERWLAVLKREKPDRIPMDYWATDETTDNLKKYLGCPDNESLFKRLHIDRPLFIDSAYIGPKLEEGTDVFGCKYQKVNYGNGIYNECVYHPLAQYNTLEQIKKNYKWPDPDWWDYSTIKKQVEGKEHLPITAGVSEPFLKYKDLRGQEQAFIDLVEHPDIVHYCMEKLVELSYINAMRIFELIPGKVLYSYIAEDMGAQEGLMYSPEQIEEFFIPGMKKMVKLVHEAGAYVFHHNDGAIRKILPSLVEVGIDILNPIQWRCKGMEREQLKKEFGDKIIFHGGVDNQYTLPFGKKDDIVKEVIENINILGNGGGYILAPCHNIQPITPPENIVALYEAGYEYGWI